MELGNDVKAAIREHALSCAPKESCGLIVDARYIPCKNIAKDPRRDFLIRPKDQLRAEKEGRIEAVIHSHVGQRVKTASKLDMTSQQEMKIPWGISYIRNGLCSDVVFFGDQIEPAPLEGREFIHGIYDCWSLVRDYFRLNHSIVMPNPPRSWGWWETGGDNLYLEGITLGVPGFKDIRFEDPRDLCKLQKGDIIFASIRSKVINHAAIYLGGNLILNHLVLDTSRVMPLSHQVNSIRHICRYEGDSNA